MQDTVGILNTQYRKQYDQGLNHYLTSESIRESITRVKVNHANTPISPRELNMVRQQTWM